MTLTYFWEKLTSFLGQLDLVSRVILSGLRRRSILGARYVAVLVENMPKKSSRFQHVLVYVGDDLVYVGDILGWGRDKRNAFFGGFGQWWCVF